MPLRPSATLLLFLCAAASAQSPMAQPVAPPVAVPWTSPLTTFKETDFKLTYSYPSKFVPADTASAAAESFSLPTKKSPDAPCVEAPLSVGYADNDGNSVLVLSIIGNTCPSVLADASKLEDFVEIQVKRQLERYGVPTLTHRAARFTVDGRPAAIATASARATATQPGDTLTTTYAAKVCFYSSEPNIANLVQVICLDFTTQQRSLLQEMLTFPIQFNMRPAHPLVPANTLR
jgi:hypothetical protein